MNVYFYNKNNNRYTFLRAHSFVFWFWSFDFILRTLVSEKKNPYELCKSYFNLFIYLITLKIKSMEDQGLSFYLRA